MEGVRSGDWVIARITRHASESQPAQARVEKRLDPDRRLDDVLKAVMAQGGVVHSCDRVEPDLEEAFSRLLATESARGSA